MLCAFVFYALRKSSTQTQQQPLPHHLRLAQTNETTIEEPVYELEEHIGNNPFKKNKGKPKLSLEDLIEHGIEAGQLQVKLQTKIKDRKMYGEKWRGSIIIDTEEKEGEQPITEKEIDSKEEQHKEDMKQFMDSVKPSKEETEEDETVEEPEGGWRRPANTEG